MIISLIAAVAQNNVIGNKGQIPWHLPADFAYFKEKTMGHTIIMGQTTFESIGRPLPGRTNIILTLDKTFTADGCTVVYSIPEALDIAEKNGETEVFFIGGASIYKQTLNLADKLYITEVQHSFEGDTYFPDIDKTIWHETNRQKVLADDKNKYDFDFVEYAR